MAYSNWRGVVGVIKPGLAAGPTEDLVRILPDGVGLLSTHMTLPSERGPARLAGALTQLDEKMAELVSHKVDLILAEGTAAYMRDGVNSERALLRKWARKFKVPISPTGLGLVRAMKAMKMKRVVGIRPYTWANGADFTRRYFAESGFEVLDIVSPEGFDHRNVPEITPTDVYTAARKAYLKHPRIDGLFTIASIMQVGTMASVMEADFGIPVVTNLAARCWEIQKHLHVRQPVLGHGRLLIDLP